MPIERCRGIDIFGHQDFVGKGKCDRYTDASAVGFGEPKNPCPQWCPPVTGTPGARLERSAETPASARQRSESRRIKLPGVPGTRTVIVCAG